MTITFMSQSLKVLYWRIMLHSAPISNGTATVQNSTHLNQSQPISPLPSPMTLLVKKITVHCRSSCCLQDNAPSRFVALGQPGIGGYYLSDGFTSDLSFRMVLRECQVDIVNSLVLFSGRDRAPEAKPAVNG